MPASAVFVDSEPSLLSCLKQLDATSADLAIDLEGNELGRIGTLSVLQIFARGSDSVFVIDITTLGSKGFDVTEAGVPSLRQILEGSRRKVSTDIHCLPFHFHIPAATDHLAARRWQWQIIFDTRNDSNALFFHHGVKLGGMYDLQLLELAGRTSQGLRTRCLVGLGKAMAGSGVRLPIGWSKTKDAGVALFASERGGNGAIWDARPLAPELIAYSAQDVALLFDLEVVLASELTGGQRSAWNARIVKESENRVALGQSVKWVSKSRDNALAPAYGWGR